MATPRCYMCDQPGTTIEHVPPRALFPERKDTGGKCYRVDLITVPSCPQHNMGKSDDDEFLMVSLAGVVGNNSIGYAHHLTKVDRAMRRSAFRLLQKAMPGKRRYGRIPLDGNKFFNVILGTPDVARLRGCFERIVRGLYLHHFKQPLNGEVRPLLGYLFHSDRSMRSFYQLVADRASIDLEGKPRHGKNQGIFYYQVTDSDENGLYLFHLRFYGGLSVYASVMPAGAERPFHQGMFFMNRGIKTVITLGDKEYEIHLKGEEEARPAPPDTTAG